MGLFKSRKSSEPAADDDTVEATEETAPEREDEASSESEVEAPSPDSAGEEAENASSETSSAVPEDEDDAEEDGAEEDGVEVDSVSGEQAENPDSDDDALNGDASDDSADAASPVVENAATDSDAEKPRGKHAAVPSGTESTGFVSAGFGEIPTHKKHRGLRAFGITLGVLLAMLAVAYFVGVYTFSSRFLPHTVIHGNDISMKTDDEVAALLGDIVGDYRIDIIGSNGFSYRITGAEAKLAIDESSVIDSMHNDLNAWMWPLLIVQPSHEEDDMIVVKFTPSAYEEGLRESLDQFNATATPPTNATITYNEKSDKFEVKPEEYGTQLDSETVLKATRNAIEELDYKVSLGQEALVQPTVFATDEQLIDAAELATGMVSAKITLVMDDEKVATVDGDSLSQFISVGENYEVTLNDEAMNNWVADLANGFNTVGTERRYTRADGKEVTVPAGGVYGWEVNVEELKNALVEGIKSGATSTIEVPCESTAAEYNGVGQRDWGARYIDVDLSEQHVRFYGGDGAIIWESDCISGQPDGSHDTGLGVWYVNAKESPSKLIGYENGQKIYETTVTFWMPFEYNSIGFHDATWQPSFGGTMYANGYGSHGCVNLSYNAAQDLYGIVEVGDPVVVHF